LIKVSAIVPAYNEESTVAQVIKALRASGLVAEIVVVSDGSTDRTAAVAREAGALVVELPSNMGKGAAMLEGLKRTRNEMLLFVDADLIGLSREHIEALLGPVLEDRADMTIGVFVGGRVATDVAQLVAPFLSGQRAVCRRLVAQVPHLEMSRFGVEVALTRYARSHRVRVGRVPLHDLTHRMKEEKLGFAQGLRARLRMYWDILRLLSCRRDRA